MATLAQDLKKQLDAKKDELKKWQNPKTNSQTGNLEIDGKVYSDSEIAKEVSRLTVVVDRLQKSYDKQVGTENRLEENRGKQEETKQAYADGLKTSRDGYLRWLDLFRTGYENGYYARPAEYAAVSIDEWKQKIVPGLITEYSANIVQLTSWLDNFNAGKPMFTELKVAPPPVATVTEVTPAPYTTPPTQLGPQPGGTPIQAPSTANAAQLAQAGIGGTLDWGALVAYYNSGQGTSGTTTSPTGGGTSMGGGGGMAPATPAPVQLSPEAIRYLQSLQRTAWLETANSRFGWVSQLYDTDPSIKALMDTAVREGYTAARFGAELRNTSWWKNTQDSVRQYMGLQATDPQTLQSRIDSLKPEVRKQASTLGLNLSNESINKLADEAVKYGWTTTQMVNNIGAEAVKEYRQGGGQAGGSQELAGSTTLQNIKGIASDYMINVTDAEFTRFTQQILTGKKTETDFLNMAKSRAKLRYSGLTDAIDRGETVRGATEDYRTSAAGLLEIDPDEVDFTDEKFAPAFNYIDETTKKPRQMNIQEWNQYIRSTPDWQNTQNAKGLYRDVAFNLARSFGMYE